jgi:hypothetical protein
MPEEQNLLKKLSLKNEANKQEIHLPKTRLTQRGKFGLNK